MIWILLLFFFLLIFLGVPVAFSMTIVSVIGLWVLDLPLMMVIQQMKSGMDHFPFLALPFFILAGNLMETGGIASRLVDLSKALIGHLRGGMGMVVCIAEIFFSGISGSSVADASAMTSIMVPTLKRSGYSNEHSVCIVDAATGMGHLIPPCSAMVLVAVMGNLSIGALFMAGFLPGFLMAATLMGLIYYQSRKGILPGGEGSFNIRRLATATKHSIIPLMMPVIIFGGIIFGVGTATEVAVLAVGYALFVGLLVYREIKISDLRRILTDTVKVCGAAALLVGSASLFSWIMATQHVPEMLGGFLASITKSPNGFLVIAVTFFLISTALMDGWPALLIFYPILFPIAVRQFGIDPYHFTLLTIAAQGLGIIMPPIGVCFFVICSISNTSPTSVFKPIIPYVLILIITLFVIVFMPEFVLFLPRLVIPGFQ